jgi:RNA-directed DNA polymerase
MNAAPFLVSFFSSDAYLSSLDEHHRELYKPILDILCEEELPPVISPAALAVLFGYSPKFIHSMSENNTNYYRSFTIKKGKKTREIKAPQVALKVIQKWFGYHLSNRINFGEEVCGFVPGRSVLTAANQHVNAKWVYSVDIKDFFPSTPCSAVSEALEHLGYPKSGASLISKLCCYGDFLAQGSPASPVLANIVMTEIDQKLLELRDKFNIRYTRYADDIVFSGTGGYPDDLGGCVKAVFEKSLWELSDDKEYKAIFPNRLKVHGLLVHGDKPRLTKGYRNKIRAFKHLKNTRKIKEADQTRLSGHISYADFIEGT